MPRRSKAIDKAAMERLERIGGTTLRTKVVDIFFARAPELFAEMLEAAARGDVHALENAAHALKSSCGNVGATTMYGLCERIEDEAAAGDLASADGGLAALKVELDDALDGLRALGVGTG